MNIFVQADKRVKLTPCPASLDVHTVLSQPLQVYDPAPLPSYKLTTVVKLTLFLAALSTDALFIPTGVQPTAVVVQCEHHETKY